MLAVVLFVVSAVVTLAVLMAAHSSGKAAEAPAGTRTDTAAQLAGPEPLSLSDFVLEEGPAAEAGPYLLRPPTPRWSEEQVRRYWVPLDEVILDIVSSRSDERIDQIFQNIE